MTPWTVRASAHLYRMLLRAFPLDFRTRFGPELVASFTDLARDHWSAGGPGGLGRLWARTLLDVLVAGLGERWHRGNRNPLRRDPHDRATTMDKLSQDIRYAARTLRKSPALTAAVVATIALGIGANTAIFTVVDAILLQPLPFPESERAVILCETNPRITDYCVASPLNVRDWGQMADSLAAVGVARTWPFASRDEDGISSVRAGIATPGYLEVYGLRPAVGRLLEERDLEPGSNRVVVLSHAFWQQRFAGDPKVVGTAIDLDGEPFAIIGVLPPDPWMHSFSSMQVWVPLTATPENVWQRDWRGFDSLALLTEGTSLQQARQEIETVRAALEREYPEDNVGWGVRVTPLRESVAGPVRSTLLLFLGAVGLVLLIGCANVANLLLVRATERAPEFAVRTSLGAGRSRLVRQLLTESLMLAVCGGVLGVALAELATRAFLALAPADIPRLEEVGLDLRMLVFGLLLSAGTALVFGLAPAWRAARTDVNETLKAARHGDGAAGKLRSLLVVAEMALAFMLLVGAGLLARSFTTLLRWDPGFDRDGLVTAWSMANFAEFDTGGGIIDMFEQAADELRSIPGVVAVGQTSAGPLFGGIETDAFTIEGQPDPGAESRPSARYYNVDPAYFATMGMTLVRGRGFSNDDTEASPPVTVVNETFARRHWPDGNALGQRITVEGRTSEIVGVVGDVRPFRPDEATMPEMYWPYRQYPRGGTYFVLRTDLDTVTLQEQMQERLRPLGALLRAGRPVTLAERSAGELVSPRFNMTLVGLFAAAAMLLAAIGTYGVIAYSVASRTHEIGVRMALGARPAGITATVVGAGMRLAALGMAAGALAAVAMGRLLSSLLYGLSSADAVTYAVVAALFLLVSLVACWLPARHASRLDPMLALRAE